MKKILLLGFAVVIILLDFAALTDINKGKEPSLLGEYLIVVISLPLLLGIGYFIFRHKKQ